MPKVIDAAAQPRFVGLVVSSNFTIKCNLVYHNTSIHMNILQSLRDPKSAFIIVASTIGFAAGIYLLWDYLSFTLMADETQGRVVAISDHYFTIQYNVEGRTFQIKEHIPKWGMRHGWTVSILYDPLSPDNARVSNYNWFYPFIWIALPLLFLLSVLYPKILGRGTDEET
jgi:hypothetical protein